MTDAKVNIERELELIDGMIEVQLHHAEQCDHIANRTMAEKQKGWDMERVALLRKMRAALAAQPAEPVALIGERAVWAILYDDTEVRHEIVHTEAAARARFAQISDQWNAHLFVKVASNSRDDTYAENNARIAAPPAPAAVPPGWKLVPIEPTRAMIASGAVALMKASDSDLDCTTDEIAAAYRAMIAAAGDKP